ncbi:MAG: tetratricopeptide repeat protein [Thermodesulfobacteriota bacterium]
MTARTLLPGAALALLLALAAAPAASQEPGSPPAPPPASAEGLLSFADALLAAGESFRAATEYLRFLHHFPDGPEAGRALEGLGRAYAQAGRWDEAAGAFWRLAAAGGQGAEGVEVAEARWLLGSALYRGERYEEAARVLLVPGAEPAAVALGTLALLRAGKSTEAQAARPDLATAYAALPRKHPATAGTLAAVLPGAGHLYADRPRDATVSFLLNAAFLWGTYEAVRREQWALAGVLGLFELGWYSGNVVSAVNAAHKWNRREEGQFFRSREEGVLPRWGLLLGPGAAGAALAWGW